MEKMTGKYHSLREIVHFYLVDTKTPYGKAIDIFIILLNLLIVTLFVIETYPISAAMRNFLWGIELVVVSFFILEYIVRLYGAPRRSRQLINIFSIIDLVAILPTLILLLPISFPAIGFVQIIRVFRVFRIFRFFRFTTDPHFFFGDISLHLLRVFRLVLTILIIFFVSAGLFWQVEHFVNDNINNFGDALYFTVIALTTVGFGDIIPISEAGRWVTILMIFSSIIFIPWQVGQIAKEWILISGKKTIICSRCGLRYHDKDASHCKSCGHVIYQEFDG